MRGIGATLGVIGLLVGALHGDTVSGSPGAAFQSWAVSNVDNDGSPYWDNPSYDGANKAIGYLLTGQSITQLPGEPGTIAFWSFPYSSSTDSGGTADLNFFLNREGPATAELKIEISAYRNLNEFGWYDVANPGTLNVLFPGSATDGSIQNFNPSAQYGFYVRSGNGQTYYSQSSLNPAGETSHQHFTLFQEPAGGAYWVSLEDLSLANLNGGEGGYGDFNDMILRLECIPEPGQALLWMVGAGCLALWIGLARVIGPGGP